MISFGLLVWTSNRPLFVADVSQLLLIFTALLQRHFIMAKPLPGVLMFLLVVLKACKAAEDCTESSIPDSWDCSDRRLTSVPQDLPTNITGLELDHNYISTLISRFDFKDFKVAAEFCLTINRHNISTNLKCIMAKMLPGVLMFLLVILKGAAEACRESWKPDSWDCYNDGLTSVPQDLPTTITGLELDHNYISTLRQPGSAPWINSYQVF
ncbi:Hypp7222 [Branchiostoma lanceolatum]|uniref:Hypp7222 protein n=1 Tax=Branchiostoma lanceolatum TaxID=7740 RepID=A0A8J9YZ12_BRALA|nr:Hypp7222 [Branchiostoma lanceolatum]